MERYEEAPDTRLERYLLLAAGFVVLLVADWLVLRIQRAPGQAHPAEFLTLAMLAALLVYLTWLYTAFAAVRYWLENGFLYLGRPLRPPFALDLHAPLSLHRWRGRWGWSEGAEKDLGVAEIDHYPPLWLFGSGGVWVLVGETDLGNRCAVALRPSPRLLALLKGQVAASRDRAGD